MAAVRPKEGDIWIHERELLTGAVESACQRQLQTGFGYRRFDINPGT